MKKKWLLLPIILALLVVGYVAISRLGKEQDQSGPKIETEKEIEEETTAKEKAIKENSDETTTVEIHSQETPTEKSEDPKNKPDTKVDSRSTSQNDSTSTKKSNTQPTQNTQPKQPSQPANPTQPDSNPTNPDPATTNPEPTPTNPPVTGGINMAQVRATLGTYGYRVWDGGVGYSAYGPQAEAYNILISLQETEAVDAVIQIQGWNDSYVPNYMTIREKVKTALQVISPSYGSSIYTKLAGAFNGETANIGKKLMAGNIQWEMRENGQYVQVFIGKPGVKNAW